MTGHCDECGNTLCLCDETDARKSSRTKQTIRIEITMTDSDISIIVDSPPVVDVV